MLLLFLLYKWENFRTEKVNNLPMVTHLESHILYNRCFWLMSALISSGCYNRIPLSSKISFCREKGSLCVPPHPHHTHTISDTSKVLENSNRFSSLLTRPRDSIRFRRLRAQTYKTAFQFRTDPEIVFFYCCSTLFIHLSFSIPYTVSDFCGADGRDDRWGADAF